jgi:hypothetical protein
MFDWHLCASESYENIINGDFVTVNLPALGRGLWKLQKKNNVDR